MSMKTKGEIETAVCERISRFAQDYLGRAPQEIRAYLVGELLVVRLHGVLTVAEQHLVKMLSPEKGRDLLKTARTLLVETSRPVLEAMIAEIIETKMRSLHHDISSVTGEEIIVFTFVEAPACRATKD